MLQIQNSSKHYDFFSSSVAFFMVHRFYLILIVGLFTFVVLNRYTMDTIVCTIPADAVFDRRRGKNFVSYAKFNCCSCQRWLHSDWIEMRRIRHHLEMLEEQGVDKESGEKGGGAVKWFGKGSLLSRTRWREEKLGQHLNKMATKFHLQLLLDELQVKFKLFSIAIYSQLV